MFVHEFHSLKIPEHCFGTPNTLKNVIYVTFQKVFLLFESGHTKLMTSLIINLSLAVFYRESLSCEVIFQILG